MLKVIIVAVIVIVIVGTIFTDGDDRDPFDQGPNI